MGTRGLLGFIMRNQGRTVRHAMYNHWDSYPSCLGQRIVDFILRLKPEEYSLMIANLETIVWIDEERNSSPSDELKERYTEAGFLNLAVSDRSVDDWYCLLYKVQGAAALPAIQSGELGHAIEGIDFLQDGLFCEWAYFIDFENQKLEVWKANRMVDEVSFEDLGKNDKYMQDL